MHSSRLAYLLLFFSLILPLRASAQDFDLSAYKGKVVYLDFWASWCVPCRLSFPWMAQLQQTLGAKGLTVVAVNVDKDRAKADAFLQQMPPSFRVVFDPKGDIAKQYDFRDMPTSILIGRDGKVHFVHDGFYPEKESEYLSHIDSLLTAGG